MWAAWTGAGPLPRLPCESRDARIIQAPPAEESSRTSFLIGTRHGWSYGLAHVRSNNGVSLRLNVRDWLPEQGSPIIRPFMFCRTSLGEAPAFEPQNDASLHLCLDGTAHQV